MMMMMMIDGDKKKSGDSVAPGRDNFKTVLLLE